MTIARLTNRGPDLAVELDGKLGADWHAFLAAVKVAGGRAQRDGEEWLTLAPSDRGAELVEQLEHLGLECVVPEEIGSQLSARRAELTARLEWLEELSGLPLYPFQRTGAAFLAARQRACLFDQMGCVDGDSIVRICRAGKSFELSLRELSARFNRGRWRANIPTKIRALCDGFFRLHEIRAVLNKGTRPAYKLVTDGGKVLRLTGDHEVCVGADRWVRADTLRVGDDVIVNGSPSCGRCGGTEKVVTDRYRKFCGYCRRCIYRHLRFKATWKGGRSVDSDGYVRVSGQQEHPRAKNGQVYEHILVMERFLGRPVGRDEVIHHKRAKTDNRIENLVLTTPSGHAFEHGQNGGFARLDGGRRAKGGLVVFVPKVEHVLSIAPDGEAEVFDVVCADPYRNFVANGVVVHNCGKTSTVLCALPEDAAALVVCPAALKAVWLREAARFRPDLVTSALSGRGSFRWPGRGEIVVTNYDVLPGAVSARAPLASTGASHELFVPTIMGGQDEPHRATQVTVELRGGHVRLEAWDLTGAKALEQEVHVDRVVGLPDGSRRVRVTAGEQVPASPVGLRFFARTAPPPAGVHLVADEAHALMSFHAERTKRFRALSDLVLSRGGRAWGLTGTPLLGKPTELWTILGAFCLDLPAFGSWESFVRCFEGQKVEVAPGRHVLEWGRPDATVAGRLRAVSLRRERAEVLPDLPEKRIEVLVETDLRARDAKALDRVWQRIVEEGVADLPTFEGMSEARRLLASCKLPLCMGLVEEAEAAGDPLLVFSAHVEPMTLLGARPGWAAITGEVPQAKRDRLVETFQRGELRGLACSIGAAGVGLTLTAGRHSIFLDRDWTPALNEQAEDRQVRIGQARGVLVTILCLDHPLDRRVMEVCGVKAELIAESVGASSRYQVSGIRSRAERKPNPRRRAESAVERWVALALDKLVTFDPERPGFSRYDGRFGRRMYAELGERGLTEAQWAAAAKLCWKYRRQVGSPPEKGTEP